MAKFKNYYKVLEIDLFSDTETVRTAFRKLARQYHPDLNAGNQGAEEKFKEINEAYETLSDAKKRIFYDESLRAVLSKAIHQSKFQSSKPKASAGKKHKATSTEEASTERPANFSDSQTGSSQTNASSEQKPSQKSSEKNKASSGSPAGTSSSTPINELFENFLKRNLNPDHPNKQSNTNAHSGASPRSQQNARSESGIFGKEKEKPKRGEDVMVDTLITPQESDAGVVKTVNVQHNEVCRRCSGTGRVNGLMCTACNGDKIIIRLKKMDVRIPAGVKNGSKVRVSGEGGRGAYGAENGDLFLLIQISERSASEKSSTTSAPASSGLRIEGLNVYCELSISVTTAALGAELHVPTLQGKVKMTVPPLTSSGKIFRLKDVGVQSGANRGDQYVTIQIVLPESMTTREKELYQELARLRPDSP